MKKVLTGKFVETVKPEARRREYCDQSLKGFGLRVTQGGIKTFFVRVQLYNKTKRITLGAYPTINLAEARQKAQEKITMAYKGSLLKEPVKSLTVKEAYNLFIELYAKIKNKNWKTSHSRLKRFIAEYGASNLTDIDRRDITSHLDKLMARGIPIQANRAHSALSRFFNWCVERSYIERSPCHGVKKPAKENPRDRVLNDTELSTIWAECMAITYPFGPLLQILILTAQRKEEVSAMRWSEIDFKTKTWIIPKERAKNGRAHNVPLSPQVVEILEGIPRFLHSDLIFTTTGKSSVSGHGKVKRRIQEAIGIKDWNIHDLRRTAATGMAQMRVPPYVVEKVLNHISGTFSGVLGVYNQHGYDPEKREALNNWAEYVIGLSDGKGQMDRNRRIL